jgi:hypothetical protein
MASFMSIEEMEKQWTRAEQFDSGNDGKSPNGCAGPF